MLKVNSQKLKQMVRLAHYKKGFTLIELILVIAIISALAGIVLVALNPAQRLDEATDAKYETNANDIEKAINSYALANQGSLPTEISSLSYGYYDICKEGQSTGCVNLDVLKTQGHISAIPVDSANSTAALSGFKFKYDPSKSLVDAYSNEEYTARINYGTTLTEGLVGYWKMDEASWGSVIDSSGNGNNRSAVNGATVALGKYGNAGSFDGINDYVDITNNSFRFGPSDRFTISTWFYKNANKASNSVFTQQGSPGNFSYGILGDADGILKARVGANNIGSNIVSSLVLSNSTWYHVIAVFDGDSISLYINGVMIGSTAYTYGSINAADSSGYIGNDSDSIGSRGFNGRIDDVRIYNRALNTDEVTALFNFGAPPIAHWRFDEGSGTIAADSSGNNLNGTLLNGPTWVTGKYGNAISFDGTNDHIEMTDIPITQTNYSFTFWANPSTTTFLGTESTSGASCFSQRLLNRSIFTPAYANPGSITNIGISVGTNGVTLCEHKDSFMPYILVYSTTLNSWTNFAVVNNNNIISLYINGNFIKNAQNTSMSRYFNATKISDNSAGFNQGTFGGSVDDVRIYNYALTPSQVMQAMHEN